MFDPKLHAFCNEFYVVAKSIEVVVSLRGNQDMICIDALESITQANQYSTASYILDDVPLTNGTSQSGRTWIRYDLPWTSRNSADDALRQALSFLKERVS